MIRFEKKKIKLSHKFMQEICQRILYNLSIYWKLRAEYYVPQKTRKYWKGKFLINLKCSPSDIDKIINKERIILRKTLLALIVLQLLLYPFVTWQTICFKNCLIFSCKSLYQVNLGWLLKRHKIIHNCNPVKGSTYRFVLIIIQALWNTCISF